MKRNSVEINQVKKMDKAEKLDELTKIAIDPLEFLKFVRIQEPGELAVEYKLWPHLVEFYRALQTYKFIDCVKSKQIGISWALAITALREIMTIPGWSVLEISKGMVEAQELLAKSAIVYKNLPDWLKSIPEYREPNPNSTEQFGFEALGSVIQAFPSTKDAGIGKTSGRVIHDEADFHEFYLTNLSHTSATVRDSPERKLVAVSTINDTKQDSDFQQHWKRGEGSGYPEAGKNGYKALFYGVFSRPDRDQTFYDQLVSEHQDRLWIVKKNYPRTVEEALSPLSATSCFKKERMEELWLGASLVHEVRQGCIHILCPPRVGTLYVAGVDVGEGLGLDYSVLTIVGRRGLSAEVAVVIYTNTLSPASFAFETDRLCREYNTPLIVIDNIGIGRAVIDKLVELGYPALYKMKGKEKVGWNLTKENKRNLLIKLAERIDDGSLITRFKPQIQEMMEYQMLNGYPEPTGRTHGDTVDALMLAMAILDEVNRPVVAKMFQHGRQIW